MITESQTDVEVLVHGLCRALEANLIAGDE